MSTNDWIVIIVAMIGAIGGIGAFVNGKRAITSDAASKVTNDALKLLEPYKARVVELEKRLDELENELKEITKRYSTICDRNDDLQEWAERLVHQVQSMGGKPVIIRLSRNSVEIGKAP